MSKARDEYYKNITPIVVSATLANNYIKELEQVIDSAKLKIGELYNDKINLEQQKAELIASLAIALDDNRRKLYKDCLLKTLNKLKENQ